MKWRHDILQFNNQLYWLNALQMKAKKAKVFGGNAYSDTDPSTYIYTREIIEGKPLIKKEKSSQRSVDW